MEDIFSTREIASTIWITLFLTYAFFDKGVQQSLLNFLRALFTKQILIIFLILISYVSLEVLLLQKTGLWNYSLLKDTLFWFFFSAIALASKTSNNNKKDEINFYRLVKENLSIAIFLEFILTSYTFGLVAELFFTFITAFLIAMVAFGKRDPKNADVVKFCRILLSILWLWAFVYSTQIAWGDSALWSIISLRQIVIGPILTILFIPLLYYFSIYLIYESMFWRISRALKDEKDLIYHAKRRAIKTGKFKLKTARRLSKVVARKIWNTSTIQEIDYIFDEFNRQNPIKANDIIEWGVEREKGEVKSVLDDFAMVSFKDGVEEMWIGELKVIKSKE